MRAEKLLLAGQLSDKIAATCNQSLHAVCQWCYVTSRGIITTENFPYYEPSFKNPGTVIHKLDIKVKCKEFPNPGLVMWDFVMEKSGAGADFLRELRFLLPIYISSASPQSSSLSPEAGTIGQEWPQCQ
jgi:hypothetical protein